MKKYLKYIIPGLAILAIFITTKESKAYIFNPTTITSSTIASSGAATVSGNNTFTGSNTFTATTTTTGLTTINTYVHAQNTLPAGFSDYGSYLNSLCPSGGAAAINIPGGSFNVSTTIVEANGCLYLGGGGTSTQLIWTGAQGGILAQINSNSNSHGYGGGFMGIEFNGNNATTTNPNVCVLQGGSTGAVNSVVQANYFINCGNAIKTASTTYFINDSTNLFANNGQSIDSESDLYPTSGEGMLFENETVLDAAFNNPLNCILISGAESVNLSGLKNDDCQLVIGKTGNGAVLAAQVTGGDSENPAASSNPNYPAYDMISIASNTFNNVTISAWNFTQDASSTTSTPGEFIGIGGGTLSFGGSATLGGSGTSTTNLITTSGSVKIHFQSVTGLVGSNNGNGYKSLINGQTIDPGSMDYITSGVVGQTGYAIYNSSSSAPAYIRADANAGVGGVIYGDNGNTEWVVGNDGTHSDSFRIGTSTANITANPVISISHTTGIVNFLDGYGCSNNGNVSTNSSSIATVAGSNCSGIITWTTTPSSTVTLNFSPTWISQPSCFAEPGGATEDVLGTLVREVDTTTSTLTIRSTSAFASSSYIMYGCIGNPN